MPSVVFDVVGTCFTYDNGKKALQDRLGDKLAKEGIPAQLLMYAWITSTERDYSYLSQIKQYKPFIEIMRHSFTRLLFQAGVKNATELCSEEDMAYILSEYKQLKPREGLAEMLQLLRESGFEVWCCTDANQDRVKGYFDSAGIEMPLDRILSADEIKAGKPEAAVYEWAKGKAEAASGDNKSIFAGGCTLFSLPDFLITDSRYERTQLVTPGMWQQREVPALRLPIALPTSLTLAKRCTARWTSSSPIWPVWERQSWPSTGRASEITIPHSHLFDPIIAIYHVMESISQYFAVVSREIKLILYLMLSWCLPAPKPIPDSI